MNYRMMSLMTNQVFFTIKMAAIFSALLLASCATKPPVEKISTASDPSQEIAVTEESISDARSEQVDVFAPQNFRKATKSLAKAKESRADQDKNEEILEHVAESRAWLAQAKQKSQVSKAATTELELARTQAVEAGVRETHPKEFKNLEKQTRSFTEKMEDGNLAKADKKSQELIEAYRKLEVKSVQSSLLGMADDNIKTAKDEGAKKSSPKSLSLAEDKYKMAADAIEKNPRNMPALQAIADEVTRESEHLLMVTRRVKGSQNSSTEDLVLKSEMQDRAIAALTEEKAIELAQVEAQNEQLLERSQLTQEKLLSLEEKQALQTKVGAIRDNFAPGEAEVLQDGDKVVIRLKGLNFKSNQANIEPNHYNLLNKVKESLATLSASQVVIEGHTDSIGKAELNRSLSAKRAEAVEQYLVSNNALNEAQVEARGLGFEKPITENKTRQGRAQNRRIDLIVTPQ